MCIRSPSLPYTLGVDEGREPLEFSWDLRRPIRRLVQMADLAESCGEWIDKHTLPEVACHLAAAFDASQLTVAQAEEFPASHWAVSSVGCQS